VCLASSFGAHGAATTEGAAEGATDDLKEIVVTGHPSISELGSSLQDTPQNVTVIPQQVLTEQAVNNLQDALKNVPGITLNAGEGGTHGDNINLRGFAASDDFGNVVNPMIVEGQVHGGLAQGIGQALLEGCVYNSDGQLLTGSLTDYALPRADDLPHFAVETAKGTPCTHNPLGVKGCGEAGAIGSPPAVINAILDALAPLGVRDVPMPATPYSVWQAIQAAKQS